VLIAYLYDEITPEERASFESHLDTCARCRTDLEALGGVRRQLARWAPPEPGFSSGATAKAPSRSRTSRFRDVPVWAQAVAATLLVGLSAGVANLDIRFDRNGLSVRTGWSRPAPSAGNSTDTLVPTRAGGSSAPWQSDLAGLEQRLRQDLQAQFVALRPPVPAPKAASSDAELMRRLKALIDESERRQQSELALRVNEVVRAVNSQRQADLRKIDQNIGLVQNRTGAEVLRQREMLNYLVQRVSQRQ
jgi:anti-sigma factor RsiW